ncbi:MAG: TIM barrel protein [Streptosporangiales bacterium]|nr:TIM barrel protein [Streptosporangiales bacterium]
MERVAGAPISWGVCEVPGWGYQLSPERVLREMQVAGLAATEFGPDGFLPDSPGERAALLADHGLRAVGGFHPAVLHRAGFDPLPDVDRALDAFTVAGADTLVLAAATGADGYETRPELDPGGWSTLLANLDRIARHTAGRGVRATLHPHVGTLVEGADDVDRVLDDASIPLCLDTGHLLAAGVDPRALVTRATSRIAHVHLKDVDTTLAARVRAGEVGYAKAVAQGLYRPLGAGDVDVTGIVTTLEDAGYEGWYVLEQDTVLHAEPDDLGPLADVLTSVNFLEGLRR